jgi:hypothetical protein
VRLVDSFERLDAGVAVGVAARGRERVGDAQALTAEEGAGGAEEAGVATEHLRGGTKREGRRGRGLKAGKGNRVAATLCVGMGWWAVPARAHAAATAVPPHLHALEGHKHADRLVACLSRSSLPRPSAAHPDHCHSLRVVQPVPALVARANQGGAAACQRA